MFVFQSFKIEFVLQVRAKFLVEGDLFSDLIECFALGTFRVFFFQAIEIAPGAFTKRCIEMINNDFSIPVAVAACIHYFFNRKQLKSSTSSPHTSSLCSSDKSSAGISFPHSFARADDHILCVVGNQH
jgi:hypothetical protein